MDVLSSISRAILASALAGSVLSDPGLGELELDFGMLECSTTFTATRLDFHRALYTLPYPIQAHAESLSYAYSVPLQILWECVYAAVLLHAQKCKVSAFENSTEKAPESLIQHSVLRHCFGKRSFECPGSLLKSRYSIGCLCGASWSTYII